MSGISRTYRQTYIQTYMPTEKVIHSGAQLLKMYRGYSTNIFRYQQDVDADVGGVPDFDKVIAKLKEINHNYHEKSKGTNKYNSVVVRCPT